MTDEIEEAYAEVKATLRNHPDALASAGAIMHDRDLLLDELKQTRAERDAALKLVDDTLLAVGHQHDLGLSVCSCGKLMPPREVDPGEIAHISATERDQLAALDKAVELRAVKPGRDV